MPCPAAPGDVAVAHGYAPGRPRVNEPASPVGDDREAVRRILRDFPEARANAVANRAFLQRAVRFLVQAGIRQFLDIGTGIPSAGNVHEVAGKLATDCRVVYADNDRCRSGCAHARRAGQASRTEHVRRTRVEGTGALRRGADTQEKCS